MTTPPCELPSRDSRTAAALQSRIVLACREARSVKGLQPKSGKRRRLAAGAPWALLPALRSSGGLAERTLSVDRAVRRIIAALLEGAEETHRQVAIETVKAPLLIVRSGPWPVLRALLVRLGSSEPTSPITVLCHRRDETTLADLGKELRLCVEPVLYPRFEPFNTSTLRRLLTGRHWRSTIVLDASRTGCGESLEHVTTALSSPDVYVWNAGGMAWHQRPLRDRLSPEAYSLVRGLLRWRVTASSPTPGETPTAPRGATSEVCCRQSIPQPVQAAEVDLRIGDRMR